MSSAVVPPERDMVVRSLLTPSGRLGGRMQPRRSYGFSVDGTGRSHINQGALFFIWLDPKAPTAANNPLEGLPAGYRSNIHQWGEAYGCVPSVFNGAACYSAVAEVATYPEFRQRRVLQSAMGGLFTVDAPRAVDLPLLCLYERLAAAGRWIECVDLARLAILWLTGARSVYLDTDMRLSSHVVDRAALLRPATRLLRRRGTCCRAYGRRLWAQTPGS